MNKTATALLASALLGIYSTTSVADTVQVNLEAIETDLVIDNQGTKQAMWTYSGTVPGPVVRVKQGDTVDFTLSNNADNEQSHSMDFHAAIVDVLDEFEAVRPGKTKDFKFEAWSFGTLSQYYEMLKAKHRAKIAKRL